MVNMYICSILLIKIAYYFGIFILSPAAASITLKCLHCEMNKGTLILKASYRSMGIFAWIYLSYINFCLDKNHFLIHI